jgi:hypothetical protein
VLVVVAAAVVVLGVGYAVGDDLKEGDGRRSERCAVAITGCWHDHLMAGV